VPFINRALAALKRVAIVIGIAIAFSIGLIGALILSLSSSQTRVPNIVGRDRAAAEDAISAAHLNFRVRATRPASGAKPNTVLIQIPSAGEEVKVGQTVAVDLSRPAKEGEGPATSTSNPTEDEKKPDNANGRESSSSTENRPKRNKNTNKNANDNQNNNRNANVNASTNANRTGDHNLSPGTTPSNAGANSNNRRSGVNNNRGNTNSNTNRRRPVVSATPD
jgi:beta-lactam-binding protein with PASTA domain